jgi:hypothetical protein
MHASTVAIDLAKEVFELAFADAQGRVIERKRLWSITAKRSIRIASASVRWRTESNPARRQELPIAISIMVKGSVPKQAKPITIPAHEAV